MEGIENIGKTEPTELYISDQSKNYLLETAKWAKFLAIIGFIGIGLMILIGIFISAFMGTMANASEELAAWGTSFYALISVFYIGIAVLYLYPVIKLYQFADQTKKALADNNSEGISFAFESQKSMFKFMGIMTIIVMGLYVLFILASISGAMASFI
jgi:MFS family permease